MSCKGTPSACNSKQIPRIFRNRRGLCSVRSLPQGEICTTADSLAGYCKSNHLAASLEEDEDKQQEVADKKEKHKTRTDENISVQYGVWSEDNQSVTVDSSVDEIDKTTDVETVADIEKWLRLKTRTEPVSSMDLEAIKSEGGVDQYLAEELQHDFLAKDPDSLSIDIDLSDKKLNLGYDPLLHELQDVKDNFILPEFQLDHLDPLALSPDDMMVAGEILPSTSAQPILSVPGTDVEEICSDTGQPSLMKIFMIPDNQVLQDKSLQVVDDLHDIHSVNKEIQLEKDCNLSENNTNLYDQGLSTENAIRELSDEKLVESDSESAMIEQLKVKAKTKLEPRIIKKRTKIQQTIEKKLDSGIKIENQNSEDGVMAVVAISTDKISNMTQIVINTGTGEQIYQGKTSELIEATGNIPILPKIETATVWDGTVEFNTENSSSHHETVTSNALEELGITDDIDNLQPVSVNEHGKVWQCPQEDCNREFSKLHLLKDHLLAHYGIKPFKCDFEGCAWGFYSEFRLKRHKETHLKRKDYVCEIEGCNRRFTTVYNLWSHTKLHSRPNRILCQVPDCQAKFQTKRALELHMKSHDQSHAPYVCKHEGCGKRYYSSNALTSHQRCHSYKDVDVKCSWPGCGKVFDKPCRLKAHIRSHTGCKPYLCTFPDCHWAFSSSSKLKRHQKKHTNERKFVCDDPSCGKAFMRSEHLKEHRLTHKEGRCFQCFTCNAQFSAKSSLYVHIKKHQVKEDTETNPHDTLGNSNKRDKVKEPQCSRVNPVPKSKRKSIDLNINAYLNMSTVTGGKSEAVDAILGNNNENQIEDDAASQQDQSKTVYYCPVETCTRSYITKARLRAHMLKVHGTPVEESDNTSKNEDSDCNKDYILYTVPSTSKPTEQMIMVGPCDCDTVIVSTASETNCYLPKPEPSNINVSKQSEPIDSTIQRQSRDQNAKKYQGSARTDLTFTDVWKLKTNGALSDSVGTTDLVLGTSDVEEGLLLTDELPSMYYQDEVAGTEYQVLLLDSVPSESTINLRGLE